MKHRQAVLPGVFQLQVLGVVVRAVAPITIPEIRRRTKDSTVKNEKVALALDRLLRLGLVAEDFLGATAIYTATDKGAAYTTEKENGNTEDE